MEYPSVKPVEQPSTVIEPKADPIKEISVESIEKPVELGYIKEYLKFGESASHFDMPELISEADEFVLSEIKRLEMKSDRKSFEEIVDGLLKKLNLPNNVDDYTKMEKLVDLMRIQKKLVESIKEREDLLNTDPADMTSAQLKKYINKL